MESEFYTATGIDESLSNDQISDLEEGFMLGYLKAGGD
jgi:hypothetical protein